MKMTCAVLAALVVLAGVPDVARADFSFSTSTSNLTAMDHDSIYTWGITGIGMPAGYTATSATLTFYGFYDWTTETNELWIYLLDTALTASGSASYSDGSAPTDAFATLSSGPASHLVASTTASTYLTEFVNVGTTPSPRSYNFSAAQLAALTSYITNGGNIAFGLDPDCHFYDTSIQFSMTAAQNSVPEPSSIMLLGTFLFLSLGVLRRKLRT
jgi:hypothetical protein